MNEMEVMYIIDVLSDDVFIEIIRNSEQRIKIIKKKKKLTAVE